MAVPDDHPGFDRSAPGGAGADRDRQTRVAPILSLMRAFRADSLVLAWARISEPNALGQGDGHIAAPEYVGPALGLGGSWCSTQRSSFSQFLAWATNFGSVSSAAMCAA